MNKSLAVLLASAVLSAGALAQTSVNSQTDVSASENASASANRGGVNAQSDSSAQPSQQTSMSQTDRDSREQHPNHPSQDRDAAREQHPSNRPSKDRDKSQPSASTNGSLANGSTIQAVLSKPVDSRRCKEGDQVFARTTSDVKSDGKVIIPKGSKLYGHVTEAKASTKESGESRLGMMFDHATTKYGQEVPMHTVIQAVASAQNTTATDMGNDSMVSQSSGTMSGATSTGGGLLRGVSSGAGATAGTVTNATANLGGAVNSTTSAAGSLDGRLTPTSNGVLGMPGLNLTTDATNSMQGTLFTCKDHNVRLNSGTQMMLKVVGQ